MQDITLLKEALPYLRRFKNALFVIKFGGEAMRSNEALTMLAQDISFLWSVGIKVVIIHGGGNQVTEMEKKLGLESRKVAGRRVTSSESLDVLKMVIGGKLNIDIVSALTGAGVKAIGMSGVSAGAVRATKRPPVRVSGGGEELIDFGRVGDIESIDAKAFKQLLDQDYLPVLCPLAADEEGNVFNINSDIVASRIASELKAHKLLLMTATLGVMTNVDDPTTLISQLDSAQAREAISQGIISGGMIPKVEEALRALESGVRQVHILSGVEPHQLLFEVFTESGCGTMLLP